MNSSSDTDLQFGSKYTSSKLFVLFTLCCVTCGRLCVSLRILVLLCRVKFLLVGLLWVPWLASNIHQNYFLCQKYTFEALVFLSYLTQSRIFDIDNMPIRSENINFFDISCIPLYQMKLIMTVVVYEKSHLIAANPWTSCNSCVLLFITHATPDLEGSPLILFLLFWQRNVFTTAASESSLSMHWAEQNFWVSSVTYKVLYLLRADWQSRRWLPSFSK